ncbi:helix-turn-helix domain-containing protein [Rahnella sp. SAP-1]|uniref:Helix-turn-helix domain-containing protein n=1 Tax=Rouxiella aceris TaxID=2703884 RepID=A0A848MGU2_9GAMM|nr:helix-turn-helix domain-containing protein [Rouxiella aceris]NMP26885.1 helix-turn-helix domain-containing protein [Rouxiella aceris]
MKRKLTEEDLAAAKRLKSIWTSKRVALGLTQEKAADLLGFNTQGAVSHYLNGVTPLNTDTVIKFSMLLNVKPEDIKPELAEILSYVRKSPSPEPGEEISSLNVLTSQHRELIRLFDKMPESEKIHLLKQLDVKAKDYDKLLEELLELRKKSKN